MTAEAPELAGWVHAYSGKVRDLYVPTPVEGSVGDPATPDTAPTLDTEPGHEERHLSGGAGEVWRAGWRVPLASPQNPP